MKENGSGEAKPLTLAQNARFAARVLKPIMKAVDHAVENFDEERLKATLEKMHDHNSMLAAWPFPETMVKSGEMADSTEVLEKIVELITLRKHQKAEAIKRSGPSGGKQVLDMLGLGGL